MRPPDTIVCPECGGTAHLLTLLPDDVEDLDPDMTFAYRCEDCTERFDLLMEEEGGEPD